MKEIAKYFETWCIVVCYETVVERLQPFDVEKYLNGLNE